MRKLPLLLLAVAWLMIPSWTAFAQTGCGYTPGCNSLSHSGPIQHITIEAYLVEIPGAVFVRCKIYYTSPISPTNL